MKAAFVHQASDLLHADAAAESQADPRYEVALDDFPIFNLFMDELGIPEEYHLAFLKPWLSTSPLEMGRIEHRTKGSLTADQLRDGVTLAAGNAYEQASALQHYVERYGVQEMVELHETFGIVNFARGSAELLHDQLVRWQGRMVEDVWTDGRGHTETRMRRECDQPRWINIVATDSDNPALHKRFDSVFSKLGPHGFVFEAATEKQLARAAVKVGNRERMAWRDPSAAGGGVRLVIVSAHGTPSSLYLSDGHELGIEDYAAAYRGRRDMEAARIQRDSSTGASDASQVAPNTFIRHLGWQHEVVLDACATGGESELYAYNLASAMAYGHQGRVTGAPVNVVDFAIKRGRVVYTVRSGREISGVTEDMTRLRSALR
jgi:hypothetical protein